MINCVIQNICQNFEIKIKSNQIKFINCYISFSKIEKIIKKKKKTKKKKNQASQMSFSKSAQNTHVKGGHLHASCRRVDGSWNETNLNLDQHIGNDNGNLVWGAENFSKSCQNITVHDGHILKCEARRMDGSWNHTQINLDERIGNNNGHLVHG